MPGVLAPITYEPIKAVRSLSGGSTLPTGRREQEAATQTFNLGVPLRLVAGFLQECTFGAADIVYGFSQEPAHNLTVAGTPQDLSEHAPINQPSGITTPIGAWIRDGRCGVWLANAVNVFSVVLKAGQTFSQALLVAGTLYGLTKDAPSGLWFLDTTVTVGNSAVAELLELDPSSPNDGVNGTRVLIQIAPSKRYFQ